MDAFEKGGAVKRVFPHQTGSHGHVVKFRHVAFIGSERFDFAGEHQGIIHQGPAQRFDAHGVSSEDQFSGCRVPERNGVHPIERSQPSSMVAAGHAGSRLPCSVVGSKHGFGVACRLERVGGMVGSESLVVVDLPVEDHHRAFCTGHGLLT